MPAGLEVSTPISLQTVASRMLSPMLRRGIGIPTGGAQSVVGFLEVGLTSRHIHLLMLLLVQPFRNVFFEELVASGGPAKRNAA